MAENVHINNKICQVNCGRARIVCILLLSGEWLKSLTSDCKPNSKDVDSRPNTHSKVSRHPPVPKTVHSLMILRVSHGIAEHC